MIPIVIGALVFGKGTGRVRKRRTNRDSQDYRIVAIGQNTEKSPRDQRTLVVTETPVKNHQLTLVSKLSKSVITTITIT